MSNTLLVLGCSVFVILGIGHAAPTAGRIGQPGTDDERRQGDERVQQDLVGQSGTLGNR